MAKDTDTKKQHFVPQFLLNKFAVDPKAKNKQIHAFDKWEKKQFKNSVRNVGCKRSLYDIDEKSLEPAMQKLDDDTAKVLQKIMKAETLSIINQEEHAQLALFLCVQMVRTLYSKDTYSEFRKAVFDMAERKTGKRIVNGSTEPDERDEQIFFLSQLRSCVDFLSYFKGKIWYLMKAPPGEHFVIGDVPFVKSNYLDASPYGNLGLASKGIELYLPLSKRLSLALMCDSWGDTLLKTKNMLLTISQMRGHLNADEKLQFQRLLAMEESWRGGPAYICDHQNIIYVNSLQIQQARRYVFSPSNDFSFARTILKQNPETKEGLKMDLSNFYR
nr:DUF4238 domain-containing protein [uncultured Pseudodesulfovibrio sp.]